MGTHQPDIATAAQLLIETEWVKDYCEKRRQQGCPVVRELSFVIDGDEFVMMVEELKTLLITARSTHGHR